MSSTSLDSTATMKSWKKKTNATFGIDEKGIGSGRSSPGSRWRRFKIVTAVWKSDRRFIGAFLPELFSEIYQFVFYLSYSSEDGQSMWSSCANLSTAMHFSSVQPSFSCESRFFWISSETIVNSTKILFDASLPRVVGHEMLFLCISFVEPSTTRSPHPHDVVRDSENIQSPLVKILAGFIFSQEMSTSAIDHSLIPIKKAF